MKSLVGQARGKPLDHRRLAGAAGGDVADADRGSAEVVDGQCAALIHLVADEHRQGIERLDGRGRAAGAQRPEPAGLAADHVQTPLAPVAFHSTCQYRAKFAKTPRAPRTKERQISRHGATTQRFGTSAVYCPRCGVAPLRELSCFPLGELGILANLARVLTRTRPASDLG